MQLLIIYRLDAVDGKPEKKKNAQKTEKKSELPDPGK